jgi:hypothetical protein
MRSALGAVFRAIVREQPRTCTVVVERRLTSVGKINSAVVVVAPESSVQPSYEAASALFDEKRGGLGLALPLARRVIERHGGGLWAPSGEHQRGAAIVSLPLAESTC